MSSLVGVSIAYLANRQVWKIAGINQPLKVYGASNGTNQGSWLAGKFESRIMKDWVLASDLTKAYLHKEHQVFRPVLWGIWMWMPCLKRSGIIHWMQDSAAVRMYKEVSLRSTRHTMNNAHLYGMCVLLYSNVVGLARPYHVANNTWAKS